MWKCSLKYLSYLSLSVHIPVNNNYGSNDLSTQNTPRSVLRVMCIPLNIPKSVVITIVFHMNKDVQIREVKNHGQGYRESKRKVES